MNVMGNNEVGNNEVGNVFAMANIGEGLLTSSSVALGRP